MLLRAASLNSAVKILRYPTESQLPNAQYYIYEAGCYANGVSIALSPAYVKYLRISKREAKLFSEYLTGPLQEEDFTISYTVVFPDGKKMDVKCCGAQKKRAWAEAVLFDENYCELCRSEVSDRYDGTWELEYQGRRYVTIVRIHR